MFRSAFWHDLDMLRWFAHALTPIPLLIYLHNSLGAWFAALTTCIIVLISIFSPPGRFTVFASFPRARTLFSVFFGVCLLLTNTLAMCGVTGLIAHELGAKGRLILFAGATGGIVCIILSVVLRTPFRQLFHIPPDVLASIKDSLKNDES